jgi:exonuclease III
MPARQRRRQRQVQGVPQVLRLATHNVRGLACHLQQLARQWVESKLDVVCVQETHCPFFDSPQLARDLNAACHLVNPKHRGFTPVWCFNTTGNGRASAGIVVLVRTVLLVSGAITWVTTPEHATRQH